MQVRHWVMLGAVNGFVAVSAGAFGAHGLKGRLSGEMLAVFETAARYQMYHALALLAVGWMSSRTKGAASIRWAGWFFLVGIVLFSGSLYALSISEWRLLGAVTPLGGVAFLCGWLTLANAARKML